MGKRRATDKPRRGDYVICTDDCPREDLRGLGGQVLSTWVQMGEPTAQVRLDNGRVYPLPTSGLRATGESGEVP